jgi:arylformamidase
MKLFDVTRPIDDGMVVYDGDPPVAIRRLPPGAVGAHANVSEITLGSHTGTHVDPPLHIYERAPGVDELPLDVLIGPARLYEIDVRERIDVVHLGSLDLAACPRVLFKTCVGPVAGNSASAGAGLTAPAARMLVDAGVRLVGLDGPSADPPGAADLPAHRTLLAARVVILEGLDLSGVPPGAYELLCLPLRLRDGDGAPARVVLRAPD